MPKKHLITAVAALALVALAVAAVVQWRSGKSALVSKVSLDSILAPFRAAGNPLLQKGFEFVHTRTQEGRKVFTLHAERVANYRSGVQDLENVQAVIYGEQGEVTVLSEKAAYETSTGKLTLSGNVRLRDEAGMEAVTDMLTYEEKTATAVSETPVRVRRGAMQGEAQGMRYETATGLLTFEGGVDMQGLEGAAAGGPDRPLLLRGERMQYRRNDRLVRVWGAGMIPSQDGGDGWKKACAQVTGLPAPEDPRRYDFWSPSFRVVFDGENLERVESDQAVRIEVSEAGPEDGPLVLEGMRLTALYDAEHKRFGSFSVDERLNLRRRDWNGSARRGTYETAKSSVTMEEDNKLGGDDWSATAQCTFYDIDNERMTLLGDAQVRSGATTVRGDTVIIHHAERRLEARGAAQVIIRDEGQMGLPADAPKPGEPVYVYANEAHLWDQPRMAEFLGAAVLRRGQDTVSADRIWADMEKSSMDADGNVLTHVMSAEEGRLQPTKIAAKTLHYSNATRIASYRGGCSMMREDVAVRSRDMDVHFAPEGDPKGGIEKMRAEREVTIESPGRIGRGDWAEYLFAREEAILGGAKEVEVREFETGRTARGRVLTYAIARSSLGIYTDAYGRTVSATLPGGGPAAGGSEGGNGTKSAPGKPATEVTMQ